MTYRDLYAGIDLDLEGHAGALKGTYTVAPGRDSRAIRWHYAGTRSLRLGSAGALELDLGSRTTALGIAVDDGSNVYVTGVTESDNFPTKSGAYTTRSGSADVFLTKLRSDGQALLYSTFFGGSDGDYGMAIAIDDENNAYAVGNTSGISGDSFPIYTTIGANGTGTGVLVAKLDPRLQYWIPVASRAGGANGSQWRTDLRVENGSTGAAAVSVRLTSGSRVYATSTSVATDNQTILTDVVGQLGFTGNGAIEVLADRPVRLSSRTYNAIPGTATCYAAGTFGQNYDVPTAPGSLKKGESVWLAQLVETAAYRANIVVTNTGRTAAAVTVSLYDGAGAFLTSFQLALAAGEAKVDSQPFLKRAGKGKLQRAYARVWVDSGFGVVASASVVDNLTNDPTTIAMIPGGLAAGDTAWLVQLSETATYRTNLSLTNTGPTPASVTVTLFDADGVALTAYSIPLAGGEMKQDNRPFSARAGRTNLVAGSARVSVTSGSGVVALASVVDNTTNDPTTISPLP